MNPARAGRRDPARDPPMAAGAGLGAAHQDGAILAAGTGHPMDSPHPHG